MSGLEGVVRPFQTDSPFNARYAKPSVPADGAIAEPVVVSIGKPLDGKYRAFQGAGFEAKSEWEEKSRRTEIVRVTNPENPANYVDVERIQQLVLQNKKTGEELNMKMNW